MLFDYIDDYLYDYRFSHLITQKDFDIYPKTLKSISLINIILSVNQRYFV